MNWESCTCQSNGTKATMTPVSPPITKVTRKPKSHSIGRPIVGRPASSVAIHANTWMPVGTATIMLAAEKKMSPR